MCISDWSSDVCSSDLALLRKTRPDIAQRIIAGRLPLECRWSRDVGSAPGVREETVHLGGDIGVCSDGDSEIGGRDHDGTTGSAENEEIGSEVCGGRGCQCG